MNKLPIIKPVSNRIWKLLNKYYRLHYGKILKPLKSQKGNNVRTSSDTGCPLCGTLS